MVFDASKSRDPDGSIVEYTWDFNESGTTVTTTSPTVVHNYKEAGVFQVELTTTDDDGLKKSLTREIDVAGLEYNQDLDVLTQGDGFDHLPDDGQLEFTLNNNWSAAVDSEIVITSMRIDPPNSVTSLQDDNGPELSIDGDADGDFDSDTHDDTVHLESATIPTDGVIVRNLDPRVPAGTEPRVEITGFPTDMHDEHVEVTVRHFVADEANTTYLNDSSEGLDLLEFETFRGSGYKDIDLRLVTSERIEPAGTIDLEVSSALNYDADRSDFSESCGTDTCTYVHDVSNDQYVDTTRLELQSLKTASGTDSNDTPIAILTHGFLFHGVNLIVNDTGTAHLDLRLRTAKELDELEVELSKDGSGTLELDDFDEDCAGHWYCEYEAHVTEGVSGTFKAEVIEAEDIEGDENASRGPTSLQDVEEVSAVAGIAWFTSDHWNNSNKQRVINAKYGDHAALDKLQLGYNHSRSDVLTYYPMDDDAGDNVVKDVANNHDASPEGPALEKPGLFDTTALMFGGDGDRVEDSDAENYLNGRDAFTISTWVKANTTGTDRGIVNAEVPEGDDDTISIRHDAAGTNTSCADCYRTGLTIDEGMGTGEADFSRQLETSSGVQTTNWQHVAYTWDGTTGQQSLYVNGTNVTSFTDHAEGSLKNLEGLWLGQGPKDEYDSLSWNEGWKGQMDEFMLFDRALSDAEVDDLADRESGYVITEWDSKDDIPASDAELRFRGEVDSGESVRIKIYSDTDGDDVSDEQSDWVTVTSDDATVPLSGLSTTNDKFRARIELDGGSVTNSPTVDYVEVYDGSVSS
jgi:hypothetical protein